MEAHYVQEMRREPTPDIEPNADQLACHVSMKKKGVAIGNVCFSIYGPHADRTKRVLSMVGLQFDLEGNLFRGELKGPPTIAHWFACWKVLQCALILINAVDSNHLIDYGQKILDMAAYYGEACWPVLYQAEFRFRRDAMERYKRAESRKYTAILAENREYPLFDKDRPWNRVFQMAVQSDCDKYWNEHVEKKCFMVLMRIKAVDQYVDGDCAIAANDSDHLATRHGSDGASSAAFSGTPLNLALSTPTGLKNDNKRKRGSPQNERPPAPAKSQKVHRVSNGRYTHSRKGVPICMGWQNGSCTVHTNGRCTVDGQSVHVCNR